MIPDETPTTVCLFTVSLDEIAIDVDREVITVNPSANLARATKCSKHLYSLSLNPPMDTEISAEEFEAVADKAEERLGLSGQPRVLVIHEKIRIDGRLLRAVV